MSRFNNPVKLQPQSASLTPPVYQYPVASPLPKPPSISTNTFQPSLSSTTVVEATDLPATLGFGVFCVYILSGQLNEWTMRYLGGKAYLSIGTLLLLPVLWLASRTRFRGLQHTVGTWWIAFLACLVLATPFSIWRGGSAIMLMNYVPRSFLCFFYITAFATSMRRCRNLMMVNIIAYSVTLISCFKFGTYSGADGRFFISDSLFFANSNELALTLLLSAVQFGLLLYGGPIKKLIGVAGILVSVVYMLRTGSRGCLVAGFALILLIFFISRNKLAILVLTLPILAIGLIFAPSQSLHRLMLLSDSAPVVDAASGSAIGSSMQRQELFKRSLVETLKHPLFGVGPDQFAVAVAGQAMKRGEWAAWVGTHNSYTQVSSECGIPAFVCYLMIIVWCFRLSYRIYKQSSNYPELNEITALSFYLLASTLVYAVGTFFFHMAYSGNLPGLAGMALAIHLAARPVLEQAHAGRDEPTRSLVSSAR